MLAQELFSFLAEHTFYVNEGQFVLYDRDEVVAFLKKNEIEYNTEAIHPFGLPPHFLNLRYDDWQHSIRDSVVWDHIIVKPEKLWGILNYDEREEIVDRTHAELAELCLSELEIEPAQHKLVVEDMKAMAILYFVKEEDRQEVLDLVPSAETFRDDNYYIIKVELDDLVLPIDIAENNVIEDGDKYLESHLNELGYETNWHMSRIQLTKEQYEYFKSKTGDYNISYDDDNRSISVDEEVSRQLREFNGLELPEVAKII